MLPHHASSVDGKHKTESEIKWAVVLYGRAADCLSAAINKTAQIQETQMNRWGEAQWPPTTRLPGKMSWLRIRKEIPSWAPIKTRTNKLHTYTHTHELNLNQEYKREARELINSSW